MGEMSSTTLFRITLNFSSSTWFGFSRQGSPQRILHLDLGVWSLWFYHQHHPPSLQPLPCPLTASINTILGLSRFLFPGSSIISWASFSQWCWCGLDSIGKMMGIIIFPILSKPHQSCLSCFLSKPSHLHSPSDVRISDIVHSCQF